MVNAASCTQEEILNNIRRGNFYSSQGPEFKAIEYSADSVTVETSPVTYVRLIGPRMAGDWIKSGENKTVLQAKFKLPPEWPYARLEIEDADGKRAWSNPLWFSS